MINIKQVKFLLLLLNTACLIYVRCQDVVEHNDTKTVDLQDPQIDSTIKSALENGTVSEVVVRKDLLLFPINAPNLVIAHSQEIHAVPQINDTNTTDGKPTAAQVAEINEYSVSQLVSNDTDNNNETESEDIANAASTFPYGAKNDSVLEPGQLLEIVSGYNLSDGVATEKVALPAEVQNLSIPKQSIVGLLSKSLAQPETPLTSTLISAYRVRRSVDSNENDDDSNSSNGTEIVKRSVDSDEDDDNDDDDDDDKDEDEDDDSDSNEDDSQSNGSTEMMKRSVDSEEDDGDDDSDSKSTENDNNDNSNSTSTDNTSTTDSTKKVKKSVDSDEDDDDSTSDSVEDDKNGNSNVTSTDSSSTDNIKKVKRSVDMDENDDDDSTTVYYDHMVNETSDSLINDHKIDEKESLNEIQDGNENLNDESNDDMDVAEDIVFRPLFRYRQETQFKQRYSPYRRSYYRKPAYNSFDDYGNRYRYKSDNSDYD